MRKFFKVVVLSLVAMTVSMTASAQRDRGQDNGWWDRVKSEQIAFLTSEMNLTPSEAQTFWPIYNQADKERFQAQEAVFKAFRALDMAVKDGKTEKELTDLVKAYAKAQADAQTVDSKYINEYLKILSGSKVAKLCVGEEKFRQQQIFRLRRGPQADGNHQPQKSGEKR